MQLVVHPKQLNSFTAFAARGRAVQIGTQPVLIDDDGLAKHTYPVWYVVFLLTCSTELFLSAGDTRKYETIEQMSDGALVYHPSEYKTPNTMT